MAITGTYTARVLISDALRKLGVVAMDEAMTADQADHGLRALNRMMKAWQNRGVNVWGATEVEITLTTAASYTFTARPVSVEGVRLRRGSIDTPMQAMTRQEYFDLPQKTSTGTPTCYYFDRQRDTATLYVWPVLVAAAGETLRVLCTRELEDQTDLNAAPDAPSEFWDAMVYGLAARLADDFSINAPNVVMRAEEELRLALAFDREGSVFFYDAS